MIFIENEKFSQKILFVTVCVRAHCQKMVRKMKNFKFFLIFWITIFLTVTTQNFIKIGEKKFRTFSDHFCTTVQSKKIFSPILTKICVVIVKNMVIQNIKKKFKIFHFSDHFLTVCANAHCDEQNFLGKFFIFNENDLVWVWGSSQWANLEIWTSRTS